MGALFASAVLAVGLPATTEGATGVEGATGGVAASFELLRNGDFSVEPFRGTVGKAVGDGRLGRVPFWRTTAGSATVIRERGRPWLRMLPGASVDQPLAAYAPMVDTLLFSGRIRGTGTLSITDGAGKTVALPLQGEGANGETFAVTGTQLAEAFGRPPVPRLLVALLAPTDSNGALWSELSWAGDLPCPTEDELREEIVVLLHGIFGGWLERATDSVGPRETAFAVHVVDVVTGERLTEITGGVFLLFEELLLAAAVVDDPVWRAGLEAFLEDYLTLGLHPETGLPRRWDAVRDVPLDDQEVEVALDLRFLLNAAEVGPEPFRERSLAAARRLGEWILRRGVLPDGTVASKYRPSDGMASTAVPPIRFLNVPAELARLAAATGDERFLAAARGAIAELEFTHLWTGTWEGIDPGFDDDFGNLGARAVDMIEAHPGEEAFRTLAASGFEFYAPLWLDALRYGGNVAADQVRCWRLLADYAKLGIHPEADSRIPGLLLQAARGHFHGEQYGDGSWGDVTYYDFDPRTGLQVGDLPGLPANLLVGLGSIYDAELGLRTDEVRAMYTAVLRSTVETYRRPFGYLTRREVQGHNHAGGGLRFASGLVAMLRSLR